jgi:hypothetical protein
LPNAVHRSWRSQAEPAPQDQAEPVLRYLPGTRSHDRDFAQVAPVLSALLRERPALRLELVGPLSHALDVPADQVQHRPRLPFADYLSEVRRPGIHLAPLETTPFTACKSALKVIEAAFWNQPTVCSPLPDAQRLVGAGACVAATAADWHRWITRLLDEPAAYRAVTAVCARASCERPTSTAWRWAGSTPCSPRGAGLMGWRALALTLWADWWRRRGHYGHGLRRLRWLAWRDSPDSLRLQRLAQCWRDHGRPLPGRWGRALDAACAAAGNSAREAQPPAPGAAA